MKPIALVTGASRGIGRAIARQLAQADHDIIAVARDRDRLDGLAAELRHDFDARVFPVARDLSEFKPAADKVRRVLTDRDRLDVLVHSAGIFRFGTGELDMEDLDALLKTNVMAVHNINQVCLPYLRRSPRPHIFAIASITGVEPFAPVGGYVSSKHALVGYIRSIARQEQKNGIRATAICPDVVDTDMSAASGLSPAQMIRTEDIAKTIQMIMSLSPAATVEQITIGCNLGENDTREAA